MVGVYNWKVLSKGSEHHSASNLWSAGNTQLYYMPEDWDSVRAWILKAGSGWHLTDLQNMNKYAAGSLGAVTMHCIKWVLLGRESEGTLGPRVRGPLCSTAIHGGANAKLAASVASWADYRRWAQESLPTLSVSNHWNKWRRHDCYYNLATRVTQMHDIVKTFQEVPESAKEIPWSEGPWLGEELEKTWGNYYEVHGHSPFANMATIRSENLSVLTSAALPSTSPSSICTLLSFFLLAKNSGTTTSHPPEEEIILFLIILRMIKKKGFLYKKCAAGHVFLWNKMHCRQDVSSITLCRPGHNSELSFFD